MPTRPLSDASLQLIHALRESLESALAEQHKGVELEERAMFGCYCFFVDGKLCMGVKNDELLVRLPPPRHSELLETEGLRELSPGGGMQGYFWISPVAYTRRADWLQWVQGALAYNPQAKATPKKKRTQAGQPQAAAPLDTADPATTDKALAKRSAKKSTPRLAGKRQSTKTPEKTGNHKTAASPPHKHSVFDDDDDL